MKKAMITHLFAIAFGAAATFGLLQLQPNAAATPDSDVYVSVYEVSKTFVESVELEQSAANTLQVALSSGRKIEIDLKRKTPSPIQGIAHFDVSVDGETGTIDSNGTYVSGDVLISLVDTGRYSGSLASK